MKNTSKIFAGLLTIAAILLAGVAQLPSAAAHVCTANNHGGCDGHSCEAIKPHDHRSYHWYGEHWCRSDPAVGAIYGPLNSFAVQDVAAVPLV